MIQSISSWQAACRKTRNNQLFSGEKKLFEKTFPEKDNSSHHPHQSAWFSCSISSTSYPFDKTRKKESFCHEVWDVLRMLPLASVCHLWFRCPLLHHLLALHQNLSAQQQQQGDQLIQNETACIWLFFWFTLSMDLWFILNWGLWHNWNMPCYDVWIKGVHDVLAHLPGVRTRVTCRRPFYRYMFELFWMAAF